MSEGVSTIEDLQEKTEDEILLEVLQNEAEGLRRLAKR